MKHDKNFFGCKTDVISTNDFPLKYSDTTILFLPVDTWNWNTKIAAFSDIQFSTKKSFAFSLLGM